MKLTLRPCEPGDFETLHRIDQACYEPGIAYSRSTLREYLALAESHCLVAVADGRITGFLIAFWHEGYGHVITIDVVESARRHGVASAMLVEIERQMSEAGVRLVELETATNNRPAVAFWEKHGYRAVGVYPRYYVDRIDAFRMLKEIASLRAGPPGERRFWRAR